MLFILILALPLRAQSVCVTSDGVSNVVTAFAANGTPIAITYGGIGWGRYIIGGQLGTRYAAACFLENTWKSGSVVTIYVNSETISYANYELGLGK